jgi:hypothetical protein
MTTDIRDAREIELVDDGDINSTCSDCGSEAFDRLTNNSERQTRGSSAWVSTAQSSRCVPSLTTWPCTGSTACASFAPDGSPRSPLIDPPSVCNPSVWNPEIYSTNSMLACCKQNRRTISFSRLIASRNYASGDRRRRPCRPRSVESASRASRGSGTTATLRRHGATRQQPQHSSPPKVLARSQDSSSHTKSSRTSRACKFRGYPKLK